MEGEDRFESVAISLYNFYKAGLSGFVPEEILSFRFKR